MFIIARLAFTTAWTKAHLDLYHWGGLLRKFLFLLLTMAQNLYPYTRICTTTPHFLQMMILGAHFREENRLLDLAIDYPNSQNYQNQLRYRDLLIFEWHIEFQLIQHLLFSHLLQFLQFSVLFHYPPAPYHPQSKVSGTQNLSALADMSIDKHDWPIVSLKTFDERKFPVYTSKLIKRINTHSLPAGTVWDQLKPIKFGQPLGTKNFKQKESPSRCGQFVILDCSLARKRSKFWILWIFLELWGLNGRFFRFFIAFSVPINLIICLWYSTPYSLSFRGCQVACWLSSSSWCTRQIGDIGALIYLRKFMEEHYLLYVFNTYC